VALSLAASCRELTVVTRRGVPPPALATAGIRVCLAGDLDAGSFDLAVECTGNDEGFDIAQVALRPRGTLVMKSTYVGGLRVDPAAIVVNELALVGSRCGPFGPAVRLLAEGKLPTQALIDHRYRIEDGVAAFARAAQPGTLKVLLDLQS
jgi:threonine dehydrogenase-like Zn-dependent dehydrogenase